MTVLGKVLTGFAFAGALFTATHQAEAYVAEEINEAVVEVQPRMIPEVTLQVYTVNGNGTNFRNNPGTSGTAVLGSVNSGARVARGGSRVVSGQTWLHIMVLSGNGSNGNAGRIGWIRSDLLSRTNSTATVSWQ